MGDPFEVSTLRREVIIYYLIIMSLKRLITYNNYIFSATGSHNFKYSRLLPRAPLAMTNISLKIITASKSLAKNIDVRLFM